MNLLDMIQKVLGFQDWKEASALPGWRARKSRMKHSRTPFSSSRKRGPGERHQIIEQFIDKDERNARYQQLRAKGTFGLAKFSTVNNQNQSVWCIAR